MHKIFKLLSLCLLLQPVSAQQTITFNDDAVDISCSVLSFCDVALEEGEQLQGVQIGDTQRWAIDSVQSGSGSSIINHLIIKPLALQLDTSMLVATDRRTYHLNLHAESSQQLNIIKFSYPKSLKGSLPVNQTLSSQGPRVNSGAIDTDYILEGDEEIMPEQIFNDGQRTYIKMSYAVRARQMPALIVTKSNGWFEDDTQLLVNYRIQGTTFVVDCVIDEAQLVLGQGSSQLKVEISYGG